MARGFTLKKFVLAAGVLGCFAWVFLSGWLLGCTLSTAPHQQHFLSFSISLSSFSSQTFALSYSGERRLFCGMIPTCTFTASFIQAFCAPQREKNKLEKTWRLRESSFPSYRRVNTKHGPDAVGITLDLDATAERPQRKCAWKACFGRRAGCSSSTERCPERSSLRCGASCTCAPRRRCQRRGAKRRGCSRRCCQGCCGKAAAVASTRSSSRRGRHVKDIFRKERREKLSKLPEQRRDRTRVRHGKSDVPGRFQLQRHRLSARQDHCVHTAGCSKPRAVRIDTETNTLDAAPSLSNR